MSSFDSTKRSLPDILKDVTTGKIQLPDFQRGWVWDDENVRSLLVSVARSFPVGAVMLLETGGDVHFQVRPIENVDLSDPNIQPDQLILDGQQRLTSLTQVLALEKAVKTRDEKKRKIDRYYYIDIKKALESDLLDEAFFGVDTGRQVKSDFGRQVDLDLSSRELECKQLFFPCTEILNSDGWEEDLQEYAPGNFADYIAFRKKVLTAFRSYQLPIISLGKETSKEAVCLVFEKVNTGGVSLTAFELITATFAAEGFNLRDDWFGSQPRKIEGRETRLKDEELLKTLESTDFLQAVTLLHTFEKRKKDISDGKQGKLATPVSAKRSSMLRLEKNDYLQWADDLEQGFKLAARFLKKECFYSRRDIPYRTQIVPLAAVLTLLKERWLEPKIYDKLSQWFWCGVLGELYGGAVETRMANDLEELFVWFDNDAAEPRTIYEASFQPNRLNTLRSRNSAAYKGLNILVLRGGARDFFWKAGIQELDATDVNLDIHHIFPKQWCIDEDIKRSVYDSIVNKTPISYKANRMIGKNAPSVYLGKLETHKQVQIEPAEMDQILESHQIPAEQLRADDFQSFYTERSTMLLALIESVMKKAIDSEAAEKSDE